MYAKMFVFICNMQHGLMTFLSEWTWNEILSGTSCIIFQDKVPHSSVLLCWNVKAFNHNPRNLWVDKADCVACYLAACTPSPVVTRLIKHCLTCVDTEMHCSTWHPYQSHLTQHRLNCVIHGADQCKNVYFHNSPEHLIFYLVRKKIQKG